ncbi:MAG: hypothetical protein WDO69_12775 [Pseudomonadota bacterium]
MTLRLGLVALCFCGLTACTGRALDLDQEAPPSPAEVDSDPGLPASLGGVRGVWVDDQRLYWLAAVRLQSCLKADCKHTTLTYPTQANVGDAVVGGGHVYWWWNPAGQAFDSTAFACPAEGCSTDPVTIVQEGSVSDVAPFAYQGYFYWSSAVDLYRCPASGCAATPEVVASGARAYSLVFDEAHAYWLDWAGGLSSAPVDGSEPPKLLIPLAEQGALAVGGGYLYWTARKQVFRCAIASCDATPPTLLATDDSEISDLEIDDTAMYWVTANSIHSCPLSGCEQSQVLTPPRVPDLYDWNKRSFALDGSDIYWIDAGDLHDTRTWSLSRISK